MMMVFIFLWRNSERKEAFSFEIHIGDSRGSPPSSSVVIVFVHNIVI